MFVSVKKIFFRILLIFFGLFFVFLVFEFTLRAMYWRDARVGGDLQGKLERSEVTSLDGPRNSFTVQGLVRPSVYSNIVYELKPGLEGFFQEQEVLVNRHGYRGRDHVLEKEKNTFRIVGLGDSVMFGWGVGQGEPYLDVLESCLNGLPDDSRLFETLNFAVPGYNTTMEVATFEKKALAFDPDLVVIHFVDNDFGVPLFMNNPDTGLSLKESYFWRFIKARMRDRQNTLDEGLVSDRMLYMEEEEKSKVLSQYRHMVGNAGYHRAMSRLAELTQPRAIPVVILIGSRKKLNAGHVVHAAEKHGFHMLEIEPYSEAFFARHNISKVNRAHRKVIWVAPNDSHPSRVAHTIYVEGLLDKFVELGVVTGRVDLGEMQARLLSIDR